MQNRSQKSIELLNNLIEINNRRIERYSRAVNETEGSTMRSLFSRLAETSRLCKNELGAEVKKLGGTPAEGIENPREIYCSFNDLMFLNAKRDCKVIFNSFEFGEDIVGRAYCEALDMTNDVILDQEQLIKKQYSMIRADQNKIKNLREAFIKNERSE